MFKTRLVSGIVLVIAALILIIAGGDILLSGLFAVSVIGLFELYRVFHVEKTMLGYAGYLGAAVYYLNLKLSFIPDLEVFVLGLLVLLMTVYVLAFPKYRAEQVFAGFLGVFYVAVMLSCIYQTRMLAKGSYIVWLIFLCSWGCDTCAYCVGVLIGKHKMAPKLSPKKSVEGAVGGILGTMLLTILYGFAFQVQMQIAKEEIFLLAGITAVGGFISMIGDLAASAIKRNYEIKDYGKLIPGHGGILDRFDSVIFTAPIIYYLAHYIL
ncbi:phosphatidate cytidylyltransferase [Petralouisia muris]|uniref:Phosphatidate cytidylyltransferase n=1 Tax=Petralouisia muris TaxID=3032872 RepID=A0AC61RY69_9FIRM|nr:phosphatidate cytidylyltransferase [Petralouisia muris]TGY96957.1 phosphatidate cytidylyltransferase [Petralouisia muris]